MILINKHAWQLFLKPFITTFLHVSVCFNFCLVKGHSRVTGRTRNCSELVKYRNLRFPQGLGVTDRHVFYDEFSYGKICLLISMQRANYPCMIGFLF